MDQKSSDNDSHNQRPEEIATDLNLGTQLSEEEEGGGLNSPTESNGNNFPLKTQDSCVPKPQETSSSPISELEEYPEEQSKTESDSNPSSTWDNKGQSMESILADWNEDIEAFEMMEKDEL